MHTLANCCCSPFPQSLDCLAWSAATLCFAVAGCCLYGAARSKWSVLLLALVLTAPVQAQEGVSAKSGPVAPDGTEAVCDFPKELHQRNTTSRGQGCCTWKSLSHAAEWQNVPAYRDAWKYIQAHQIPGGASPGDFNRHLPAIAKERGYPEPRWLQYSGPDMAILDLAFKTGRMPCITYGSNHMVNAVHLDGRWGAFLDNNVPGFYLWHSRAEFEKIAKSGGRSYWCVVLLDAPPPPPPSPNVKKRTWQPTCDCGCGGSPCTCKDCPFCSLEDELVSDSYKFEQCPNCQPASPGVRTPHKGPGSYEWRQDADSSNWYGLFRDGHQVGAWNSTTRIYRPYNPSTDRWQSPRRPPIPPPNVDLPTGCRRELPAEETFWLQGKIVSRAEAIEALRTANPCSAGSLVDDSLWLRATVIGPQEQVERAMPALQAELQGKPVLWQGYQPGDWPVRDMGFTAAADKLTIYLQGPDGTVYSRTTGYPGPVRFARAVEKAEALRRPNPAYDDTKTPDLTQPERGPLANIPIPAFSGWLLGMLGASGLASGYELMRKPA